jgi:hypothetical protein
MICVRLEAVAGPIAGRRIDVKAGSILRIGRTAKSDYPISEDAYLSGQHFAVECDGIQARVRDLGSSNGTYVNGSRIQEVVLKEGDSVAAGGTTFTVHVEQSGPSPLDLGQTMAARTVPTAAYAAGMIPGINSPPVVDLGSIPQAWAGFTAPQVALLQALYRGGENVYAVLDAARESRIPAFLDAAQERFAPLVNAPDPRSVPFVVGIPPNSRLLDVLLKDGWGRQWGCFLTSNSSFDLIYQHLRAYSVLTAANGQTVTFRFFDPRILRVILSGMTPVEVTGFFGPVSRIICEGDDTGVAFEFRDGLRGVRQESIILR